MQRADRETKSIPAFSARNQNWLLTATEPIGSAVSTRCLASGRKQSHGCNAPWTWAITTTHGLFGTRIGTSCAAIVIMNESWSRSAITTIDISRNLAHLLSELFRCYLNLVAEHINAAVSKPQPKLHSGCSNAPGCSISAQAAPMGDCLPDREVFWSTRHCPGVVPSQ